jgi:hypothetical protein
MWEGFALPPQCPNRAITRVIHWTGAEVMEPHSAVAVDFLEEALEELSPVL